MTEIGLVDFLVFTLWLHLLAVVVWMGGMLFLGLALCAESTAKPGREDPAWATTLGRRVYVIGWEALGVIVLTGIFNLIGRMGVDGRLQSEYITLLLIKLSLIAGMAGVQLWQQFGILPQLAAVAASEDAWAGWRRRMLVASAVFLALAAGTIWMGVRLHRGG